MSETLADVLDGALYTETIRQSDTVATIAVWHGGHTVNVYHIAQGGAASFCDPVTAISVGDFADDDVSLTEAQAGIEAHFAGSEGDA